MLRAGKLGWEADHCSDSPSSYPGIHPHTPPVGWEGVRGEDGWDQVSDLRAELLLPPGSSSLFQSGYEESH